LVGALLIGIGFGAVCLAAASIYLVGATGTWLLVPPSDVRGRVSRPPSLLRTIGIVTRDRIFVLFTIAMAGYYVLATQLFITIPLETERLTGSTNSLGLVYLTNSIIAVALQFPLVRFTSRRFSNLVTITIGTVLIGTGLLSVAGAGGLVWLLGSVVIIALGRVLIDPTMNMSIASVASRAGDGLLASYFGFSALSVAIGGAAGQLLGGWLYDRAENSNVHALPWLVMGAVAVVVSLALLSLSRTAAAQQLDSRRA
jgi:DHA1 family multidrug resistance protein-like MFS transporter